MRRMRADICDLGEMVRRPTTDDHIKRRNWAATETRRGGRAEERANMWQRQNRGNGSLVGETVGIVKRSVSTTDEETIPSSANGCTNNNSLPKEVSFEELELLKKLEAANR